MSRRLRKRELFGFHSCEGLDYRFVGSLEYQIVEAKTLFIYRTSHAQSQARTLGAESEYHFSVGAGPVLLLTLDNLKGVFPDNHSFHDALDQMFGAGQFLAQYDTFHKMFKVNRLLDSLAATSR